jgi:Raf kinase inhibitor-like YbhB/YbcL family protein
VKSFALVVDDPDAPDPRRPAPEPWVHWVLFNIPAEYTSLPEGVDRRPEPTSIAPARQGLNSWPADNVGYRGPAPPPGSGVHRYRFRIYALDTLLDLPPGVSREQLQAAMQGRVVAEGELLGVYQR